MSQLGSEKCVACRADSPKVTQAEINNLLPEIPDWEITSEKDVPQLTRLFSFKGFSLNHFSFRIEHRYKK